MAQTPCVLWKFMTTKLGRNQVSQYIGDWSSPKSNCQFQYLLMLNTIINHSACLYTSVMKNLPRSNMILILENIYVHPHPPASNEVFYTSLSWFPKGHPYTSCTLALNQSKREDSKGDLFTQGQNCAQQLRISADTSFCFLCRISSEIVLWPSIKAEL